MDERRRGEAHLFGKWTEDEGRSHRGKDAAVCADAGTRSGGALDTVVFRPLVHGVSPVTAKVHRPRCSELARPRHHLDKVHRSKNSPGNHHRAPRRANFVWGGFEGHTELRNHSPIFSLRSGPYRTVFCAVEPCLIPELEARTDCTKLDHPGRTVGFWGEYARKWRRTMIVT